MVKDKIITTSAVRKLLLNLIQNSFSIDPNEKRSHQTLSMALQEAYIMHEADIPEEVIQLNSIVTIKTSFGYKRGLKLVLPSEADISKNKLSVLSPAGASIFGEREGSTCPWFFSGKKEMLSIEKVERLNTSGRDFLTDCTYYS